MASFASYLRSTIGKKLLVGISGLALSGFVLLHMAGNLLLFAGPEAYNTYSHKLTSTPLIYVAEAGLVFFFLLHIGLVTQLTLRNRDARPEAYAERGKRAKRTSWIARTLILSGLLIFVFVVLHLITFKWGTLYMTEYGGVPMRDLYRLVLEKFKDPLYVAWYVVSMVVLGMHLSHGVAVSFQSLGLASARNRTLRAIGNAFAIVVCGGFIAQPVYMYFFAA